MPLTPEAKQKRYNELKKRLLRPNEDCLPTEFEQALQRILKLPKR